MRLRFAALFVLLVSVACQRTESSITGNYGSSVVTGQVVVAAELGGSPAGVTVSASGTGMSMVLAEDGRFAFTSVPGDVVLHFTRADGIDASVRAGSGPLVVEINKSGASGRRRGSVPTRKVEYEGVVRATTASTLTLFDSHGQETTFSVTASTAIRKGGTLMELSAIQVNDRVHVKALPGDTTNTALEIIVQQTGEGDDTGDDDRGGQTMTANGTVKTAGATELVVSTVPKGNVTVKIDASTIIRKRGDRITGADIKAGDQVNCMGTKIDDHSLRAVQIEVRGTSGK